MRIYFSGGKGYSSSPEVQIGDMRPHVMLTFFDMDQNSTRDRFNVFLKRVTGDVLPYKNKPPKRRNRKKKNEH